MKHFLIVFRKELTDTLRDRRTLTTMLLVPLLIYPLLMIVFTEVTQSQAEKSMEKVLRIALVDDTDATPVLRADLEQDKGMELVDLPAPAREALAAGDEAAFDSLAGDAIRNEVLDMIVVVSPDFSAQIAANTPGNVRFYYNAKAQQIEKERMEQKLTLLEQLILRKRYAEAGIDESFTKGLAIDHRNVATQQEILGDIIGGFLPYLFILLCFTGSMYPAIDLAAGEKERGTIETILTTPVSTLSLVLGKIGVIMLTGLTSAVLALLSITLSFQYSDTIPVEINDILTSLVSAETVLLLIAMLIPMALLFASILLSLSIYAKSFKEAQSIITPMMIFIIFPAFLGMLPGMELTAATAVVPILNISLVTKQIMAGTLDFPLFLLAVGSMLFLSAGAVVFSVRWFGRESVVLR